MPQFTRPASGLFINQGRYVEGAVAVPFVPTTVPGLTAWYDASQLVGLVDDDPVLSFTDATGNGHHATPADVPGRPTYKTGVQNGLPAVRFDGSYNFVAATFTLPQPATVFIVARYAATNKSNKMMIDGIPAYSNCVYLSSATGISSYANGLGLTITTTPLDWHIYTSILDGASSALRADEDSPATGGLGAGSPGGITIGQASTIDGSNFPGDIGEILVFSAAVSGANQALMKAYLKAKWATP